MGRGKPISKVGLEKLQEEMRVLKEVARPNIIEAVSVARAHGDLKENAEYHAAREKHGMIEKKIGELLELLTTAQVVDTKDLPRDIVVFGSRVTVFDEEFDEEETYTMVGEGEADVENNRISVNSPIAQSLLGHKVGDKVTAVVPAGDIELEIRLIELD